MKNVPIVRPEPKDKRVEKTNEEITKIVDRMIANRQANYNQAIDISHRLGHMVRVFVTPHLVTNQFGTTFTRCFYYMQTDDGFKLTPLSTIMSVFWTLVKDGTIKLDD